MGRFFWAWWIIVLAVQAAVAQGPQLNKLEATTGVVEMVGPGMLQILDAHGTRWKVMPAPNARVEVVGSTTRDMLQKGQFVSCEVMFDDAGKERFEIAVAPEATFSVNTTNVGLAAKGDSAEMEGVYQAPGQLLATVLKITLANPVNPPPSRGARKAAGQP